MYNQNATARWMSAVILGEMVFWDIPCSLLVPSLKDPLMLGHHIVMTSVCAPPPREAAASHDRPESYCYSLCNVQPLGLCVVVIFYKPCRYVAWVGAYSLPCCYYLFFFGLAELSSVPLQVSCPPLLILLARSAYWPDV